MHRLHLAASALAILVFLFAACAGSPDGERATATPGAVPTRATPAGVPTPTLRTIDIDLGDGRITVEVADDQEERIQGLSDRAALAPGSGMLFAWDQDGPYQLWMKGMRFALDFVWLDATKTVIQIDRDVPPPPGASDAELERYGPSRPSRYVIELNAGDAARLGIEEGNALAFDVGGD
jgi:uncharacterized membrane protein (UPF0127 family)